MLSHTDKALVQESIDHWKDMQNGDASSEPGANDCPLCRVYLFTKRIFRTCIDCPVTKFTGRTGCRATPYIEAHRAFSAHGRHSLEFKKAAELEIQFLEKVLAQ